MEGEESQQPTQRPGGGIRLHTKFIKTPTGIAFLVNLVLFFISVCAVGHVNDLWNGWAPGYVSFLLGISVITFLEYLILLGLMLFGVIPHMLKMINWPLTFVINCAVWAVLYLIATIVFVAKTSRVNYGPFNAASAFGFFATIGLIVQGALQFMEWQRGGPPQQES